MEPLAFALIALLEVLKEDSACVGNDAWVLGRAGERVRLARNGHSCEENGLVRAFEGVNNHGVHSTGEDDVRGLLGREKMIKLERSVGLLVFFACHWIHKHKLGGVGWKHY